MFTRLQDISNRRLLQQLYPYAYDVKESVKHLTKCVKWLGKHIFTVTVPFFQLLKCYLNAAQMVLRYPNGI